MFTFKVSNQNSLCFSLRSNKCDECISFIVKVFNMFTSLFTCLCSSLLLHCLSSVATHPCMLRLPTVNRWNSVKPATGMCIVSHACVNVNINYMGTNSKTLFYSALSGQKLHTVPLKVLHFEHESLFLTFCNIT